MDLVEAEPAHVAAVARVQHAPRYAVAHFPAVARHLRALAEHRAGDGELLVHDRRRAFLARNLDARLPAGDRHLASHVLGELHRLARTVTQPEHGHGRAETEETHAVTALAQDLVTLLAERQARGGLGEPPHVVERHPRSRQQRRHGQIRLLSLRKGPHHRTHVREPGHQVDPNVQVAVLEVLEAVTELGYSAVVLPLQRSFLRFLERMKKLNIVPSPRCDDLDFVRRLARGRRPLPLATVGD